MSNIETFDFGDGQGPVPAHRHVQGGGWVADTARVDPDSFVGARARVFGRATVGPKVALYNKTSVSGSARVSNVVLEEAAKVDRSAQIHGSAWATAIISGQAHIRDALLYGPVQVGLDAVITSTRHVFTFGPIGSENCFMTVARIPGSDDPFCAVGCWSGRLSELPDEVEWRAPFFAPEYELAIKLAEHRAKEWAEAGS